MNARGRTVWNVVSIPDSIDATGTDDVTADLLAFFLAQPRNSIISFPVDGSYRVEGTMRIDAKSNWTINGNGSKIFATTDGSATTPPTGFATSWPRKRCQFAWFNSRNITMRDLWIQGANPSGGTSEGAYVEEYEAQHCIELNECSYFSVIDCDLTDMYGDGFYLGQTSASRWCRHILVDGVLVERTGRQGIGITGGEDIEIRNCTLQNIRRAVLDIEPNFTYCVCRNIWFHHNTFGAARLRVVASKGAAATMDGLTIEYNTGVGKALEIEMASPETGTRKKNIIIRNNTSDTGFGTLVNPGCFFLARIDNITVTDNVQPLQSGRNMHVLYTQECCGTITASGNTYTGGEGEYLSDGYVCP